MSTLRSKFSLNRPILNRKIKYILILISLISFTYFLLSVKWSHNRAIKSERVTNDINNVLGTRLTAVRVMPDKNTTLIQPPIVCNTDAFAVILIKSIPKNYKRRMLIRNTWIQFISKLDVHVEAYFFIGLAQPQYEGNISSNLVEESKLHGDIIIENLNENYYLLAVKTLRMLKWFSMNCASKTKFFIKTDDDMFINLPNLISHIYSVPNQWVNYIGGQLHLSDPVDTNPDSKWFAPPGWWDGDFYPPFVSGALTVISSEIVSSLLRSSLTVPLFHLEDVFLIGMVGFEKLHLIPNDIPRIESNSPEWIVRLRMAFSKQDMAKTFIAFHCPDDPELMKELYYRAIE